MESYFHGTCPNIVFGDNVDCVEAVAWAEMAWVDRIKVEKMVVCYYHTTLVDLFWVTFLAMMTSYAVDLG